MATRHAFTVYAIGEPEASIIGIRVLDVITGVWYSVYPELAAAYCTPGAGNLVVAYGAQNVGDVDGILYGRILGPGGEVLQSGSQWCHAGDFVYWEPTLDMPSFDYVLTVEVSATPDFAVAERFQFELASGPPLPLDLPVIGAAALAVVDVALIGYYAVTQLTPKT